VVAPKKVHNASACTGGSLVLIPSEFSKDVAHHGFVRRVSTMRRMVGGAAVTRQPAQPADELKHHVGRDIVSVVPKARLFAQEFHRGIAVFLRKRRKFNR
jgi:hypothetical protein